MYSHHTNTEKSAFIVPNWGWGSGQDPGPQALRNIWITLQNKGTTL